MNKIWPAWHKEDPEQESGDLKDLDGESEKTAIKIKN